MEWSREIRGQFSYEREEGREREDVREDSDTLVRNIKLLMSLPFLFYCSFSIC